MEGIYIRGSGFVTFKDLYADVFAAYKKGYVQKFAFTPETVEALLLYISQVADIELIEDL